jgi:hypothetical protein
MACYKHYTLKKMSTIAFNKMLKEEGACAKGRRFTKDKTLQKFWKTCQNGSWMRWLLWQMSETEGWIPESDVSTLCNHGYDIYIHTLSNDDDADLLAEAEFYRRQISVE